MIMALVIAVLGGGLLLVTACAGLLADYGRESASGLVAPRNAGFGEAGRSARAAERHGADHAVDEPVRAVVLTLETGFEPLARRAA